MKISKYFRTYYYQWQSIKRWDFTPTQSKIIISLTTVPSRIQWLKPTLISLLKQKPDVIELNLAKTPLKEDVAWKIPAWLNDLNAVKIFWLDKDYGPASKFIPTIERYQDKDCYIIVVDDDMLYSDDFLEKLLQADKANPQPSVFCTSGHKLKRHLDSSDIPPNDKTAPGYERVAIIQGCGGYLIKPNYFNLAQLKDILKLPGNSVKQDDVWISGLLSQYKIPKFRVPIKKRRGTINTLTPSITGDRVEPFNTVLQFFKDDWHEEEFVD
jgi:hypothetical protein